MKSKKLLALLTISLVAGLGAIGWSSDVFAGYYWGGPLVTISAVGGNLQASGSPGRARTTADTVQYIGCFTLTNTIGTTTTTTMECDAKTTAGAVATCTSSNANYIADVRSMGTNDYIDFLSVGGTCGRLIVYHDSRYMP